MKFAMFFAGEFMHVFTNGVLVAVLFMGGYHGPLVDEIPLLGLVYLIAKTSLWYLLSLLMRNALPRVRIDQLMLFNWLVLVPIAVANILMTAFLLMVIKETGLAPDDPSSFAENIPQTIILFLGNAVLFFIVLTFVRNRIRRDRLEDARQIGPEGMLPAQAPSGD